MPPCMPDSDKVETSERGVSVSFTQKQKGQRLSGLQREKDMGLETENSSSGLPPDFSLEKVCRLAEELVLPGRLVLRVLYAALELITNLLARVLGSRLVRRHFHLMLSGLVLFGPVLSLRASKFSIFANSHHYLYRKFLKSTWGWTWTFTGSFIFLFSLSVHRSLSLSLRHLSRLGLVACLWWGCQRLLTLLEDAAGTCYEPVTTKQDTQSPASPGLPLLLLHEDHTKASCLRANMVWRGYEVSQDVLILCLCCLLLVEELSVFGPHIDRARPLQRFPGAPLRVIFLLCVVLLAVWVFLLLCLLTHFPKFPSQQLGGALGYLGWKGLYQGWYRLKPRWGCPGMPGDGLFTSTDTDKLPE